MSEMFPYSPVMAAAPAGPNLIRYGIKLKSTRRWKAAFCKEGKGSNKQIDWRGASPVESRGCTLWRRVPQKRCCRKCTDDWKGLGVGLMSRLSSPYNVDGSGPFYLFPPPPPTLCLTAQRAECGKGRPRHAPDKITQRTDGASPGSAAHAFRGKQAPAGT